MAGLDVVARLRDVPMFERIEAGLLEELARDDGVRVVGLDAGQELVRAGAVADEVYVVVDGELEAWTATPEDDRGTALAQLPAGSIVGEIAVLNGGRRTASLRAAGPSEVVAIAGPTFVALLDRAPAVATAVADEARDRLFRTRLARQLATLFPGLAGRVASGEGAEDGVLDAGILAAGATRVSLASGQVLFRQGDPAEAAYVVVSGRLRVLDEDDDGPVVVAEIGAGQLAGELALLDDSPRGATLVAARDSELARLTRQEFEALVHRVPSPMLEVTRTIVRRSREPMDPYRRAASDGLTIGILPLGPGADLDALVAELLPRLRAHGNVDHLTADAVDRSLRIDGIADVGPGEAAGLRLERWLAEREDRTDLLVLQGDGRPSPWNERCAGQVDHIVLVADADADPVVGQAERRLLEPRDLPHRHVSLVLLHPADREQPAGTNAWLAVRDVDEHHHVRRGHAGDLDRLARHLAGRAVTLVLSGGGAKGFAHLGVVRALRELDVPIDAVAGASMGAPMAAMVAVETPDDELVPQVAALYRRVLDYTIPVTSLVAGKRSVRRIERAAGGRAIEDTWLPFACVSTNLTRSRTVVHRRGDLGTALRASFAIPGVLPPVPYDGELLVDGGVLNNLPLDVARRLNPTGTVIACDVAPVLGPRAKQDYGLSVSGTGVLLRRLTPGLKAPRVPALMATLMRSLMVSAAHARDRDVARGLADLYLLLELRGVGLLDFDDAEPVAQRGYEESLEPIRAWAAERAR
jgi:predicted acylesterase/phospholipase RssA/CRP-like cAMP-binding protein